MRSFVWHGPRDVDVGEVLDVPPRDAHILIAAYQYCVPVDEEPVSPVAMTVNEALIETQGNPVRRRR
ncbi:hypothetical protein [Luteitalea sp.]|uniref:hypothetical protein n=1 Tax=Luteitalea sp. TaxID=2004800 RepID=UPI0025C3C722|nr:hypothetical protein [Luteitalea sp.]